MAIAAWSALLVALGGPAVATDPDLARRIETLQEQGYAAYSRGDVARAAEDYELALRAAVDNDASIDGQFHETVKNLANALSDLGRTDDAESIYERFVPDFGRALGAEHPYSLDLRLEHGMLLSQTGKPEAAVAVLEPVLAGYRRSPLPPGDPAVGRAMNELGVAYMRAGDAERAIPLLAEAAATREENSGFASEPALTSYVNLARSLDMGGRTAESDALYARIIPAIDAALGPRHMLTHTVRTNIAGRLQEQGRQSEAIPLLRESLQMRAAVLPPQHPATMTSRMLLANGLLEAGAVEEALALHSENVRLATMAFGRDHPALVTVLGNYAVALRAAGRTKVADEIDGERLEIARRTFGPKSYQTAMVMNDIAVSLSARGKDDEALRMLREAHGVAVAAIGADALPSIQMEVSLATLSSAVAPPEQALADHDAAIARARRVLGPMHPATIRAVVNGFNFRFDHGLSTDGDAERFVELAEAARATHGPDSELTRNVEYALIVALGASARPSDRVAALDFARRALGEAVTRVSRPRDDGDPALAVATEDFRLRAFAVATLAARGAGIEGGALGDEAFRAAQTMGFGPVGNAMRVAAMRSAARHAGLSGELRDWERTLTELSERAEAYAGAVRTASAEELARMEADAAALEAERARLEARISGALPGLFDLLTPQTAGIDALQRGPGALGPDEVLVLVAPAPGDRPDPPLVWAVSRDAVGFARAGMTSPELDRAVSTFHASLASSVGVAPGPSRAPVSPRTGLVSGTRPLPVDLALGHAIFRALFGAPEIRDVLAGHASVILAPQGSLVSLPFSALPMDPPAGNAGETADGLRQVRWFGLEHALWVAPSVASVVASRGEDVGPGPGDRLAYVGFGDPAFGGPARALRSADVRRLEGARDRVAALSTLPALPATAWEVETVAGSFPSPETRTFLGADATEAHFSELADSGRLDGVGVLHFATHGLLAGALSRLEEPALALSPPAAPAPLADGALDDGLLTASEIAGRDFDADWVVLSACETGAGDTADAEGLTGLAKAFFFAGARSLLVTHWAVRDDAAARIIVRTVKGTQEGVSAAEARRRAIAELVADRSRDGTTLPYSHPAVWAPFELIGRPG